MQIKASPNQLRDLNVFYTLSDSVGVIQFIGVDKWEELLQLKTVRKKRNFPDVFTPDLPTTITVIHYGSADECHAMELDYLRRNPWPPLCSYCVCNDTSQQFTSVAEAAKAHGLSGSALYNHLNNRPGYASVKGRTYRKGII